MDTIEENLANWEASLMQSIPVGGLHARNPVVYKWKSPFRCWMVRESAMWRQHDLMAQSYVLHRRGHGPGARLLLRSGFETLATLIYLNHLMHQVLEGKRDFHIFSDETSSLAVGSRDGSTSRSAVNVLKMLDRANKRYPGVRQLYDQLSESAHPNWEGLCWGYSKVDHSEYETKFSNRWMKLYGQQHPRSMEICMQTFHHEYNDVWTDLMEKLEGWIEANDAHLESTKNDFTHDASITKKPQKSKRK